MRFSGCSFGSVRVDGVACDHDLVVGRGTVRKRKMGASGKFGGGYGHTPLSAAEDIPWRCRRLVIGTGADGALPVMREVANRPAAAASSLSSCPRASDRRAGQGHDGHQRRLAPDVLTRPAWLEPCPGALLDGLAG